MNVGYLGPKATFTELAVKKVFSGFTPFPFQTIPECMDAVVEGQVDLAVVPLENALEGSVNITLDYLTHVVQIPIVGEVTLPIKQHLMVHPENAENWQQVSRVYSHSHAIAQCYKFLHHHLKGVPFESVSSTAAAAQLVKETPMQNIAAIANELAAEVYGLSIVKRNIHDFDHNHTRFVILATQKNFDFAALSGSTHWKTTLMVTLPSNQAGALHQVLSAFAWRKLDLSKIESRPMKTGIGNYFFIIDLEMKLDDVLIPGAIAELEALGCGVKVLGSYPSVNIGLD
ncbi:prephenate dehydratase [Neobacillus thermocopriae]|uniref:Prephenate dehydratase n=1 Tax=Neobacillus thermocopriae TaxID=1215031 RepID=A0A6B3TNZ9_9BACI|nr:prephenate dehydratase [Neobacillus thermocopriae]MED3623695.1 prephenate dehydratase [Neobacillus thermocopriae]MED3712914.1 prephenate dehydratase [Neobacillus thermocopriae]NEX78332.1 prephenate dehydratase [Neobacillus thermocopriae]